MNLIRSLRAAAASAAIVLAVALIGAFPAVSQALFGNVAGVVRAENGAGLAGSVVIVTNASGRPSLTVVAGERGVFKAAGLAPGTYAVRAEAPGFAPKTLSPVEVTAGTSREVTLVLPVSTVREAMTVIGESSRDSVEAAEIRQSPARDVGEALTSTPGIWKLRKGGIANEIVVRGSQSKDLNVLIDGERIYGACPGHMDPPAFHADFAEVDRIDIVKGPFDVKNEGSLAGVVNIVTRRPETGWHASANLAGGSAGYINPSATVSFGSGSVSGLAGYSFRSSKAYVDGSGKRFTELANYRADFVDASAFKVGTAWGKIASAVGDNQRVELSYTHQDADQVLYPALSMDGAWDRSDRLNASYELASWGSVVSALKAQAYYTRVNHWMTDEYRTSAGMASRGYSMGTLASSRAVGGKIEASLLSEVTVGVEAFQRFWDTRGEMAMMGSYMTSNALPGVTTNVGGLYAEWKHPLSAKVSFAAGGRVDRTTTEADPAKANTDLFWAYNNTHSTSATDTFPSGNVRLSYRPLEGLEFTGGVGSNVRIPEPNERYYAAKRTGSDWVGNPDLVPSRNTGIDAGVSWRRSGFYAGLTLFANRVADYVAVHDQARVNMAPGIMNGSARSYANIDADLIGGELNAVLTLTSSLFLAGDLSYVRGSQTADAPKGIFSTNLAETPPLRSRISLRHDTGKVFVEAEGVFSAAQTRVDTDLEETATPGWGIANLKVGWNVGGLALTAGVSNLFDRLYTESLSYQRDPNRSGIRIPEPGRNVFANAAWRF
jgi:iron complex outermembrane receptor protein